MLRCVEAGDLPCPVGAWLKASDFETQFYADHRCHGAGRAWFHGADVELAARELGAPDRRAPLGPVLEIRVQLPHIFRGSIDGEIRPDLTNDVSLGALAVGGGRTLRVLEFGDRGVGWVKTKSFVEILGKLFAGHAHRRTDNSLDPVPSQTRQRQFHLQREVNPEIGAVGAVRCDVVDAFDGSMFFLALGWIVSEHDLATIGEFHAFRERSFYLQAKGFDAIEFPQPVIAGRLDGTNEWGQLCECRWIGQDLPDLL